jgi:glutaredoxin 3
MSTSTAREGPLPPDAFEEPVVVYTTRWCGYCWSALRLLENRGVRHAKVDVTGDREARAWLLEVTGRRTVPQIFIHGRSIGGFTELAAIDREGQLP